MSICSKAALDRAQKSDFLCTPVSGDDHVIIDAPGGYSFHLYELDLTRNGNYIVTNISYDIMYLSGFHIYVFVS